MPRRAVSPWSVVIAAALAASVEAATVDSTIDRVTMFPGQVAQVERMARIDAPAAAGSFVFEGLPAALVDNSVRLAVTAGSATLGSVEIEREPVGEPPRVREQALEEELKRLQAQRQAARDRATAAESQITFIEGLAELPRGEGAAEALAGGDSAERWSRLWERIGSGSESAHERLRENQREAQRLQSEIETVQRRLRQLGQDRAEQVTVRTDYAEAAGPLTVRLSYRVRGPRWRPIYAARLDTEAGRLTLERRAEVRQATGQDWRDVELRLSTVQPVQGTRPKPQPWWIQLAPESAADREGAAVADDAAALQMQSSGARAAGAPGAEITQAEFAATYEVRGRTTLPAGNDPREVVLGEDRLDAQVGVEIFPQRDPNAWLTAATTWRGAGPLPRGKVTRYLDGAYAGEGELAGWAPGEKRTLAFGTDPRVDVRFQPVRDEAGESGWITSQSTRVRRYELVVHNRHTRSLPVTTLFRVPVPRNEEITVDNDFSDPPSEENVDGKPGVHAWRATLDADGERTWIFGYDIRYPAERDLEGL